MNARLWYAQLDPYDAIRRMGILLLKWKGKPANDERLYIVDFYLANPPLLHETHMPSHVREAFRQLAVENPKSSFLSYPAPPILFGKMHPLQQQALRTMIGTALLDVEKLKEGAVAPSTTGAELFAKLNADLSTQERRIATFLATSFASIGEHSIAELYQATQLRRMMS